MKIPTIPANVMQELAAHRQYLIMPGDNYYLYYYTKPRKVRYMLTQHNQSYPPALLPGRPHMIALAMVNKAGEVTTFAYNKREA